jgi:hypothetical protein
VQKYPVRTSHRARLAPAELLPTARAAFETAEVDSGVVVAKFGAIVRLTAQAEGKELRVEVTMDPKVTPEVAAETVRRYNTFLEAATGFSSKERAKRLRKSATAGA